MTATLEAPKAHRGHKKAKQTVAQESGFQPTRDVMLAMVYEDEIRRRLAAIAGNPKFDLPPSTKKFLDRVASQEKLRYDQVETAQKILEAYADTNPDETGTTTPAGIIANDPSADGTTTANGNGKRSHKKPTADAHRIENPVAQERPKTVWGDAISRLSLKSLERHPDNRTPTPEDIQSRAESIKVHGLLEPIIVRMLGAGRYQVLSGETRWLAMQLLGGKEIDARVRDCDDAQALALLAEFNAQRKDLTPIDKARLMARLCEPIENGGAAFTREQAARVYGLETGAAASNLIRLLELPRVWQDRVAAGELAWTWAREILPVIKLEPVMTALEKDWKEREHSDPWDENAFISREGLKQAIASFISQECRPLNEKQYVPMAAGRHSLDVAMIGDDDRTRLEIVTVELPTGKKGKLEPVEIATNADLYDELLKQQAQEKSKSSAGKVGEDDAPAPQERTPAEKRAKAKQRAELLEKRIASWRDKLLRIAVLNEIRDERNDTGFRLVVAYAAGPAYRGPSISDLLEKATKREGNYKDDGRVHYWPCVADRKADIDETHLTMAMAEELLVAESNDWRQPIIPHALIEAYATDLKIDLAAEWRNLQGLIYDWARDLLEEFFLLHQTEELKDLAKELGIHLMPTLKAGKQIREFLLKVPQGTTKRLPLPKSIKPLAIAAGKKPRAKKSK